MHWKLYEILWLLRVLLISISFSVYFLLIIIPTAVNHRSRLLNVTRILQLVYIDIFLMKLDICQSMYRASSLLEFMISTRCQIVEFLIPEARVRTTSTQNVSILNLSCKFENFRFRSTGIPRPPWPSVNKFLCVHRPATGYLPQEVKVTTQVYIEKKKS